MPEAVFVDTSILLNLLDVPGKNGERADVVTRYSRYRAAGATLVLPVVTVIETGNHIAQLPGGNARVACARRFADLLRQALAATVPMAVSGVAWDPAFLAALVDGHEHRLSLEAFAPVGIGSGDASILHEMDRFRATIPSAMPVSLWTRDEQLASYA